MRRSTRVTTQAEEENTSAHSEKGLLVVDENGRGEVPAGDDLEEEVGIAVVVVEVPHLIDRQKLRAGEASQSPGEGCVGVLSGEFVEHVRSHGESGGEAVEDGVVEEVLHQHGLADPVRSDQDDVGGVVDEGQREELLDEGPVDAIGPGPVEVGDGLEGADACVGQAAFEGAALAFAVLDVDDALDPWLGEQGMGRARNRSRHTPNAIVSRARKTTI